MKRQQRRAFLASGLLVALGMTLASGCAVPPNRGSSPGSVSTELQPSAASPAGRVRGYQFARRYSDVVRINGKPVTQLVEYGFDYDRASTVRRVFSDQGELLSEDLLVESLRANPAEEARMHELVRTHPRLGPLMNEPGLLVHAGGFVFREPDDPFCSKASRCLRYIVSKGDGSIPHIHAVVDLVRDRIVYPHLDESRPAVAGGKEFRP